VRTLLTTSPETAASFIKDGRIAAFPTETVYGLGASVFNESAIHRIFDAKQRPADNPLIAHISDLDQIQILASRISKTVELLISNFFPGPLTVVLPKASSVPLVATAGLDSIGIRMPGHTLAREFLLSCGTPVAAPSANLSGRPSPTSWQSVYEDLDGRIDCILQGDDTKIGLESTVVDCTNHIPVLLRYGSVTFEQLKEVVPSISVSRPDSSGPARSPGMKHRHYSPRAHVIVGGREINPASQSPCSFIGLHEPTSDFAFTEVCQNPDEYARSLFEFFRESDRRGIKEIYCEAVEEKGIGAAIMDRLRRAAEE
jgi:L-threonylcarbamoyladenylate synthase